MAGAIRTLWWCESESLRLCEIEAVGSRGPTMPVDVCKFGSAYKLTTHDSAPSRRLRHHIEREEAQPEGLQPELCALQLVRHALTPRTLAAQRSLTLGKPRLEELHF